MTGSCDKLFPYLEDVPRCVVCGYRTDYRYTNPSFLLKNKIRDLSSTYDGIYIASLKFKEFCSRYGYKNLVFKPLPKTPNFFQFYVEGNVIEYKFNFNENFCSACEMYESVIGPTMNLDHITEPLKDGFYQSDLWFASGNEKSPVLIVAPKTFQNLKTEKFKDLCEKQIEK